MKFLRSILGILLGMVIGFIVIGVVQMINSFIHPMPPGTDLSNADSIRHAFAQLPFTAFIGLLVSYLFGVFFAAFAAGKVAGRSEVLHGFIISLLFALMGISNFAMLPAPIWVVISTFIIFFVAGFMGSSFAAKIRGAKTA
jgi:hypothetical protein